MLIERGILERERHSQPEKKERNVVESERNRSSENTVSLVRPFDTHAERGACLVGDPDCNVHLYVRACVCFCVCEWYVFLCVYVLA